MMKKIMLMLFSFLFVLGPTAWANSAENLGEFSGRVSHINDKAGLLRLKVEFSNLKYLNARDQVEFWDQSLPGQRCSSFVAGKSNDYLLLKIPNFDFCQRFVHMGAGTYLHLYSRDLINNLTMGGELMEILLKRRVAVEGIKMRHERELSAHIEKVNAVNARYEVLRAKLMDEWRREISFLEEDKTTTLRNFEAAQIQLNEIDKKIHVYRIEDDNLKTDRWALDPRQYIRK
jgi:tRNA U55 pseudouridine synthase TruB